MTAELASAVSPGLVIILGALLLPFLPGALRKGWMLVLPVAVFAQVLALAHGTGGLITLFDVELTTVRVDRLSLIFGYVFVIALWIGCIFQLHLDGWMEQTAGLIYAGSAIGAVFAGDLITLFLFWEGTAIASVFLIWARGTERAMSAAMRYLLVQVGSGVLLLAGAMLHYGETGSIAFGSFDLETTAGLLIFISFGIKCAFPILHTWVKDAYPEATATGAVLLSAFTTKLAIYTLARGYAGTDILVPIGLTMTLFPIVFALIEDDLRRVLSYSLIVQLGFMVTAIGIGSELAISGAAAHAVGHVVYKALLFMSIGAVLYRTGTAKASGLGGLYRTMPWTTVFCIVGAASIAAFPLFSGFVSKALIISAAMKKGYFVTWLLLLFAGAASLHYVAIRVPFLAFFGRDSGLRPSEAPKNMLVAMGIAAALCIGIGLFPGALFAILPYEVSYHVYTLEHVITQMQLLTLSALVFALLMRAGIYPATQPSTNLDVDWLWRRGGMAAVRGIRGAVGRATGAIAEGSWARMQDLTQKLYDTYGPDGPLSRTRPSGAMALWVTALLTVFLIFSYI